MDVEVWQHFEDLSNKLSELKEEPAGEIRNAEISQIAEDVCKEIEKNHKALAQDVSCGSNDEAIVLRIRAQVQALNPALAGRIDQAVKGLHDEIATIEQSVEQAVDKIALELESLIKNPANDDAHIQEVGRFLNKNLSWFRGRSSDGVVLHDRQIAELFDGLDNLRLKAEKSSSQYAKKLLKYIDTLRPTLSKKLPRDPTIITHSYLDFRTGTTAYGDTHEELNKKYFDGKKIMANMRALIEENPEEGYQILVAFIDDHFGSPLSEFGLTEKELDSVAPLLLHVNLEDFDFSGKDEVEIHAFIEKFKKMKSLRINTFRLQSLPLIVRQLESLDCSYSGLTHLPNGMGSLKILKCDYCEGLGQLPSDLRGLEKLYCVRCTFTELPGNLDSLEYLFCSSCSELGSLPSNLKGLKELHCSYCHFTELPGNLDSLELLFCPKCGELGGLPGNLKGLKRLTCYGCNFTELPRGMVSLEVLRCSPSMVLPADLPQNVLIKYT